MKRPDEWKVKGKTKRKTDPAHEDLFLLTEDQSGIRKLKLEDLCHFWAVLRLLSENRFQIGKNIISKSKSKKVPKSLKPTLMYAYTAFSTFAEEKLPHLHTINKATFVKYMMAVALVQNAKICSCKNIFNFIKSKPKPTHPPEYYEARTPIEHRPYIHKALASLNDPEKLSKILHILGLPDK